MHRRRRDAHTIYPGRVLTASYAAPCPHALRTETRLSQTWHTVESTAKVVCPPLLRYRLPTFSPDSERTTTMCRKYVLRHVHRQENYDVSNLATLGQRARLAAYTVHHQTLRVDR